MGKSAGGGRSQHEPGSRAGHRAQCRVCAPYNLPIGYYEREYGYTPQTVSSHGNAFAAGMRQAAIVPTVKHFPGLGRVTLNTDTSANVHDTTTTRTDPYLQPFRDAINQGVRVVMVSSAYYDRIDSSNIAPFSRTIMGACCVAIWASLASSSPTTSARQSS
ncbi:glycoside hydrolase family 3 N-terminal domain-containing protein [Arthrobacter alpinus]|nr:glycoside hydrolase family 3 N-terminal domain-containing protein [Arthrobacter alpinus]